MCTNCHHLRTDRWIFPSLWQMKLLSQRFWRLHCVIFRESCDFMDPWFLWQPHVKTIAQRKLNLWFDPATMCCFSKPETISCEEMSWLVLKISSWRSYSIIGPRRHINSAQFINIEDGMRKQFGLNSHKTITLCGMTYGAGRDFRRRQRCLCKLVPRTVKHFFILN